MRHRRRHLQHYRYRGHRHHQSTTRLLIAQGSKRLKIERLGAPSEGEHHISDQRAQRQACGKEIRCIGAELDRKSQEKALKQLFDGVAGHVHVERGLWVMRRCRLVQPQRRNLQNVPFAELLPREAQATGTTAKRHRHHSTSKANTEASEAATFWPSDGATERGAEPVRRRRHAEQLVPEQLQVERV